MAYDPWKTVVKVCTDCMEKAEVTDRPAAYLFDRRCHICARPRTRVYCCTDEYMDKLMKAKDA